MAVDLLPQIKVTKAKENDEVVGQALLRMPTILIAPLALAWLVNHPDYQLSRQSHVVLYEINDRVLTEALTGSGSISSDVETAEKPDHPTNNLFTSFYVKASFLNDLEVNSVMETEFRNLLTTDNSSFDSFKPVCPNQGSIS